MKYIMAYAGEGQSIMVAFFHTILLVIPFDLVICTMSLQIGRSDQWQEAGLPL